MNNKQSKRLRKLVYSDEYSFRYRHYQWDKAPKLEGTKGKEVLITGSIQADSKRKLYQKLKDFYKNGSSIKQLTQVVSSTQSN